MYAEQFGDIVQPGQGHAAPEPVVDVLGCDTAKDGKVGRGQVALRRRTLRRSPEVFMEAESSESVRGRE